ncbi:SPFH domain-containing protein [Pelomonas sp. UHG3]|uniref:SPFH domain-containing protein n=1 Tax=Roseateles hydrophilus TaxID=2975054 RepID=A0ACC6C6C9_9BURK|nr:SPFH domain-containing protein [Pelomonas sp. UHG3]MCY4743972.1 SPFH domain-containing protein [Pelomonas sp. UHG3]
MIQTNAQRQETAASTTSGYLAILGGLGLLVLGPLVLWAGRGQPVVMLLGVLLIVAAVLMFAGLYMQQPNEGRILTLFGRYTGTDRAEGLRWANPFAVKRRISLRARNLNAPTIKVNDKRGNPIEIGVAVVWRVEDSARAVFEVDDYEAYVGIQAEAAMRHLASQYAYDDGEDLSVGETTLRAGQDEVAAALVHELQARFAEAGVRVLDAKITHLAYAQEIAQVMLRRQQAEAIISARKKIVQGAVSMVEEALRGLSERDIVELDDERKAAMVSNLLVVLCSDKDTQPIVNAGTLYS